MGLNVFMCMAIILQQIDLKLVCPLGLLKHLIFSEFSPTTCFQTSARCSVSELYLANSLILTVFCLRFLQKRDFE